MNYDLSRFIKAQKEDYQLALSEIKNGKKESHWMWYIFPQIIGLGMSETSVYYSIQNIEEAKAFLEDEYLGWNLIEICKALLSLPVNNAMAIFGSPDDMKLKSSMTLFNCASDEEQNIFVEVLNKFFDGNQDVLTLEILGK